MITQKNIGQKIEDALREAAEGVDTIQGYVWRMSQDVRDLIPRSQIQDEKIYNLPIEIVEGEQILTCEMR